MREIWLSVEHGTPGCCGLDEIFEFPQLGVYKYDGHNSTFVPDKPITSDEWFNCLKVSDIYPDGPAHYFFSHADHQKGPATPKKFAAWLKRQGEKVVSTKSNKNPQGGIVTAYFWTPSDKFIERYNKFREKQEKKNDAGSSTDY